MLERISKVKALYQTGKADVSEVQSRLNTYKDTEIQSVEERKLLELLTEDLEMIIYGCCKDERTEVIKLLDQFYDDIQSLRCI